MGCGLGSRLGEPKRKFYVVFRPVRRRRGVEVGIQVCDSSEFSRHGMGMSITVTKIRKGGVL